MSIMQCHNNDHNTANVLEICERQTLLARGCDTSVVDVTCFSLQLSCILKWERGPSVPLLLPLAGTVGTSASALESEAAIATYTLLAC